jgi:hypothetical protein
LPDEVLHSAVVNCIDLRLSQAIRAVLLRSSKNRYKSIGALRFSPGALRPITR